MKKNCFNKLIQVSSLVYCVVLFKKRNINTFNILTKYYFDYRFINIELHAAIFVLQLLTTQRRTPKMNEGKSVFSTWTNKIIQREDTHELPRRKCGPSSGRRMEPMSSSEHKSFSNWT